MYATYGNIYHQYTPVMLASIYHTYGSVMGMRFLENVRQRLDILRKDCRLIHAFLIGLPAKKLMTPCRSSRHVRTLFSGKLYFSCSKPTNPTDSWWPNGGPMVAQTFGLISFDGWSLDLFGTRSFGPELGLVSLCPMFLMAMK